MAQNDKARRYDNLYNEGGEGYNPHRDQAVEPAMPRSQSDVLADLELLDCSIAREAGTYDAARVGALRQELDDLLAAELDAFAAEWTRDVTAERRAAWNARVAAGEFGQLGSGRTNWIAVGAAEREQGWTFKAMKKAVAMHQL